MEKTEYRIITTKSEKIFERYLVKVNNKYIYETSELKDAIHFAKKFLGKVIYSYNLVTKNNYNKNLPQRNTSVDIITSLIEEEIFYEITDRDVKEVAIKTLTDLAMEYKKESEKLGVTEGGRIMADLDLRLSDAYFDIANKVIRGEAKPDLENVRTLQVLKAQIFK